MGSNSNLCGIFHSHSLSAQADNNIMEILRTWNDLGLRFCLVYLRPFTWYTAPDFYTFSCRITNYKAGQRHSFLEFYSFVLSRRSHISIFFTAKSRFTYTAAAVEFRSTPKCVPACLNLVIILEAPKAPQNVKFCTKNFLIRK